MLTVKNLRWTYAEFTNVHELVTILARRFKNLSLTTKLSIDTSGKGLVFSDVEEGRTFTSGVDNKIVLKPDDDRIKKNNRDYLVTRRPTQEQYFGFFSTVQDTLDQLGLSADIDLVIKKNGKTINIRRGKDKFLNAYPAMKSYPLPMQEKQKGVGK